MIPEIIQNINNVTIKYKDLPHMREKEALYLADIITKHDCKDLLELGFLHGKSSMYFGAILKGLGRGHLTTIDKVNGKDRVPNINQVIQETGVEQYVTPIFATRSFTWELAKMIRDGKKEIFDFCYLDASHEFDNTTIAAACLSILLKPGAVLIMDDLNYIPNNWRDEVIGRKKMDDDELHTQSVKLVFKKILPELGFEDLTIHYKGRAKKSSYGICIKKSK